MKIQKSGHHAPPQESPLTQEQQKQIMLQAYRRQEELKVSSYYKPTEGEKNSSKECDITSLQEARTRGNIMLQAYSPGFLSRRGGQSTFF